MRLMNHETGLYDITALAYSPKTGLLYATDFAWMAPAEGGLFRIDAAASGVKTTKIASLERPTALAFAPEDGCRLSVCRGTPGCVPRTVTLVTEALPVLVGHQLSNRERDPIFRDGLTTAGALARALQR